MKNPYTIILQPHITERTVSLSYGNERITDESLLVRKYTFIVDPTANKIEIKSAVEDLFNVRVLDVRTQIRHGKKRRYRVRLGEMRDWKRAVVTLHPDDKIEFF